MNKYPTAAVTPTFQPIEETVGVIMARLAKRLAGPATTPACCRLQRQAMEFERVAQMARIQERAGF
jgi:hypothetical protein